MNKLKTLVATIIAAGLSLPAVARAGEPTLFAVNQQAKEILTVQTDTLATSVLPVPAAPHGVAVHPTGQSLWVTLEGGRLIALDLGSGELLQDVQLGGELFGLDVSPSGETVYVTSRDPDRVLVVDATDPSSVIEVPVPGGPTHVRVHPYRDVAYVMKRMTGTMLATRLDRLDTSTNTIVGSVPTGALPRDVAFSADGTLALISDSGANCPTDGGYTVVDATTDVRLATVPLGHGTGGAAIGPDGLIGYTGSCSPTGGAHAVSLPSGNLAPSDPVAPGLGRVSAVALSPDGSRLFAMSLNGLTGVRDLVVIDLAAGVVISTFPLSAFEPRAFSLAVSADAVQRRRGTTVITHGFTGSGNRPDWPIYLADAIRTRTGSGQILIYPADVPFGQALELEACDTSHLAVCEEPNNAEGETIVVFDWASDSNIRGGGWSEAAGESLAAALIEASSGEDPQIPSLMPLHLIGHSRGTVVNSEAAERLIAAGVAVPDQITNLDPRDWGGFPIGSSAVAANAQGSGFEDFDVNDAHPEYRCGTVEEPAGESGVCAWADVPFHDTYYQQEGDLLSCVFPSEVLDGRDLIGAAMLDLTEAEDLCHSGVHEWYYFTVDTAAMTHPDTGDPPEEDWFSTRPLACKSGQRAAPLARDQDGFNFSRLGRNSSFRCPKAGNRQAVRFDYGGREGLVNGDFEKGATDLVLRQIPGWERHGGGGEAVPITSVSNGNYLLLGADQSRWHNWSLVPPGATALRFRYRVDSAGDGQGFLDFLARTSEGPSMLFFVQIDTETDWIDVELPIDEALRGKVASLGFQVLGTVSLVGVRIDDVGYDLTVIEDGFESGGTDGWAATVP